jgi:hypothetical protein
MCNCKGWDITISEKSISLEPHFCRIYGDCGSDDRTLEEAADDVAKEYLMWSEAFKDTDHRPNSLECLHQAKMWSDRTHPDYLFYKEQEGELID